MATFAYGENPYGLRDVKLYTRTADNTYGAGVDLPAAQTLTLTFTPESNTLTGDDSTVAIHTVVTQLEWDLEAGGISLDAWGVLTGITVTDSGTTPSGTSTFKWTNTSDMPYIGITGKAISDSDGDMHIAIFKAKVTDLSGSMAYGEFWITKCSGIAVYDGDGDLFTLKMNETAQNVAAPSDYD